MRKAVVVARRPWFLKPPLETFNFGKAVRLGSNSDSCALNLSHSESPLFVKLGCFHNHAYNVERPGVVVFVRASGFFDRMLLWGWFDCPIVPVPLPVVCEPYRIW